jgi:hypothetical protein
MKIHRGAFKFWLALSKQQDDPGGYDYCRVTCDGSCRVEFAELPRFYKSLDEATVVIRSGRLEAGQRIFLKVGDTSGGAPAAYVPPTAQRDCSYQVLVDAEGTGEFVPLPEEMVVNVIPGPPHKVSVVAPSVVGMNEDFRFLVRFEDINCNPGAKYQGEVSLECRGANLPDGLRLEAADEGRKQVKASISAAGVHRIKVRAGGIEGVSNPILCVEKRNMGIYWGDMHCHTNWADGTRSIEENYIFGRDVAFLDVCGISEHIKNNPECSVPVQDSPDGDGHELWRECQKAAAEFHQPGRYITFLGYEYTPATGRQTVGDHCVYFLDDRDELMNDPDLSKLTGRLARTQALLVPHVGGYWTDWTYENRGGDIRCLVEVASMHEHSEWFGQEALRRGNKMGIVGMSDGHFGCPGYDIWALHGRTGGLKRRQYSLQSAITAFCAPELTRESIWGAMKQRCTYATTGQRTILDFRINGFPMGSELTAGASPELEVEVHGTAPIARIEIIRNDRLAHRAEPGELDVSLRWVDENPLPGESYYYVRITQADNAFAWSSPIWVTCTGAAKTGGRELPPWNEGVFPEANGTDASEHLPKLLQFLKANGIEGRFRELEGVGVFEENRGRYLLVRGRDSARGNVPIHIHYYLDFPDERVYTSTGWADYGQEQNMKADWPRSDTPTGLPRN